jgi:hypothetical protein
MDFLFELPTAHATLPVERFYVEWDEALMLNGTDVPNPPKPK